MRRQAITALLVFLALLAWTASSRSFVNRAAVDPATPSHASIYLESLGSPSSWLVLEVPPDLELGLQERILLDGVLSLLLVCAAPVLALWGILVIGVLVLKTFRDRNVV